MNHWSFVIAAYAITLLGTACLSFASYRAMRAAERRASDMGGRT